MMNKPEKKIKAIDLIISSVSFGKDKENGEPCILIKFRQLDGTKLTPISITQKDGEFLYTHLHKALQGLKFEEN